MRHQGLSLHEITNKLSNLYEEITNSTINSFSTESTVDVLLRKSKSESFQSLFNLNFILDQLKKSCKDGLFDTNWSYELIPDKIIIYNVGDYFKRHRDHAVENIQNNGEHIATFLLFLNSEHTGGNLIFNQNNMTFTFDDQPIVSDFGNIFKFILFSLDVEHEVFKVDSGFRACLKFKLYRYRNLVQTYECVLKPYINPTTQFNLTSVFAERNKNVFKFENEKNKKATLFD